MTNLTYMDCACCGGDAGRWQQFSNQDYEYGVCVGCAAYIAKSEGWPSVFYCYGVPGRNWQPPEVEHFKAEFPDDPEQAFEDFKVAYRERYDREFTGASIKKGSQ